MATAEAKPRTDLNMEQFRSLLTAERDRIEGQLHSLDAQEETGGSGGEVSEIASYDQHPADQGTELFMREADEAMHSQLQRELGQVEAAFRRLENGTYGYCERCGKPIPAERLEAIPFATLCVQDADLI